MRPRKVYCERCADVIEYKGELVTCFRGFTPAAYHTTCYGEALKGLDGYVVSKMPLNGKEFLGTSIFSLLLTLVSSLYWHIWWIMLVLCLPLGMRLWSWFLYESRIR